MINCITHLFPKSRAFFRSFKKRPPNAEYFDEDNKRYLKWVCINMDSEFDVMEYKPTNFLNIRFTWHRAYRVNLNRCTKLKATNEVRHNALMI